MKNVQISYFSSFIAIAFIIFSGCSEYQKLQKSEDWQKKYEGALKYFEKQEYHKAETLLDDVIPIMRGSEKAENAYFKRAYSAYHQGKFTLSAHYFKNFYETYARSENSKEARYMHAYSLYQNSPNYNLDQTDTRKAISAMQTFMNKYPYSDYNDEAQNIIDKLQLKLEKKNYKNAHLYYKLRHYKAAIVALENFRNQFPNSKYNEEALFYLIKTEFHIAEKSIKSKQKERYEETVNYYNTFVDEYPNSEYIKEAEKLYSISQNKISQLALNQ